MAKPRAYVETSVISYLTAQHARDLVVAAHQEVTREWWSSRGRFELLVSEAVLEEIARGDGDAAARRVAAVEGIAVLAVTDTARALARGFLDAAATHGLDFLVTWNCTHIANAAVREKIEAVCRAAGFRPPVICTPLELRVEEDL